MGDEAPLPISRHLILTPDFSTESTFDAQTAEPILDFLNEAQQASSSSSSSAPPAKRAQPTHLMKFRNHTYGFDTPGPEKTSKKLRGEVMNVEQQVEQEAALAAASAVTSEVAVESKKEKKRKTEKDDSPAKAKKKAKKSKD